MDLLDKLLSSNIRHIDFERIQNKDGRLVAFGRYAGICGACDFLRGIGEFLLSKLYQTQFLGVGSSYMYFGLEHMYDQV